MVGGRPRADYFDAEYLYSTYHRMQMPALRKNKFTATMSSHYSEYSGQSLKDIDADLTYKVVLADEENVMKSLEPMFHSPKYEGRRLPEWELAKKYTKMALIYVLETYTGTSMEFNLESVPGAWWCYFGFKTKEEVLTHPLFWEEMVNYMYGDKKFPPYKASPKTEMKEIEQIVNEKKIRTFLMAATELLFCEKYLHGGQDELMLQNQPGFIRYGVDFHKGGYNRLMKNISKKKFIIEGDVKGWDRLLCILDDVEDLRNECLINLEEFEIKLAAKCKDALVNSEILLPNGDVIKIKWAQKSGDGKTTSNNCIAHDMITRYLMICAYKDKFGVVPSHKNVSDQCGNVYGDDFLHGFDEEFDMLRNEEYVSLLYGHFSLKIKPGTWKCSSDVLGHSFLGASCRQVTIMGDRYYIPSYNTLRVRDAMRLSVSGDLTFAQELNKTSSLLELGWEYNYLELSEYMKWLLLVSHDDPSCHSFRSIGVPSRESIMADWAGVQPF